MEKRRNQILEGADDFKSKIEKSEGKEEENSKETKNKSDGSEKTGLFKDIKNYFSKNKVEKTDKNDKIEDSNASKMDRKKEFRDSLKVDVDQEKKEEPVKKTETNNEGDSPREKEKTPYGDESGR